MGPQSLTIYGILWDLDGPTLEWCYGTEDAHSFLLDSWYTWAKDRRVVSKEYDNEPVNQRVNVGTDPMVVLEREIQAEKERIELLSGLISDHRKRVEQLELLLSAQENADYV